jgi:hypothetical protein
MDTVEFAGGRKALSFGSQKINLHEQRRELEPKAQRPTVGAGDFCFATSVPTSEVISHLEGCRVPIVEGPSKRTGAVGTLLSVYSRDLDQNLIEVSNCVRE